MNQKEDNSKMERKLIKHNVVFEWHFVQLLVVISTLITSSVFESLIILKDMSQENHERSNLVLSEQVIEQGHDSSYISVQEPYHNCVFYNV